MRQVTELPLWIGHAGDARNPRLLHYAGIKALVDLAIDEPPASVSRELVYCRFPLLDGTGNPARLIRPAIQTVAALLASRTPTLVFCSAGMSRSPIIAAAALAQVSGQPAQDCLSRVIKDAPADISPGLWAAAQACIVRPERR